MPARTRDATVLFLAIFSVTGPSPDSDGMPVCVGDADAVGEEALVNSDVCELAWSKLLALCVEEAGDDFRDVIVVKRVGAAVGALMVV